MARLAFAIAIAVVNALRDAFEKSEANRIRRTWGIDRSFPETAKSVCASCAPAPAKRLAAIVDWLGASAPQPGPQPGTIASDAIPNRLHRPFMLSLFRQVAGFRWIEVVDRTYQRKGAEPAKQQHDDRDDVGDGSSKHL